MLRVVLGVSHLSEPAYYPGVARQLRDAGHEVVYAGAVAAAVQLAAIVVQEDADAVVLVADDQSPLEELAEQLAAALMEYDAADVAVHVVSADQPLVTGNLVPLR